MDTLEVIKILSSNSVKPTANILLVAKLLIDSNAPLAIFEITDTLSFIAPADISEILSILSDYGIAKSFVDGRGVVSYEIGCDEDRDKHNHVHFYCETCHKTYCIEELPLPDMKFPRGYKVKSRSFVAKGCCPSCRPRRD